MAGPRMTVAAKKLRVLNFHGIGTPARAFDPGEADYWIGVERFRSVLDRIAGHPDQEHLSITFDDGNISDLTIAFDVGTADNLLRANQVMAEAMERAGVKHVFEVYPGDHNGGVRQRIATKLLPFFSRELAAP